MPSEEISTHTLTWSVTLDVLCDTARVTDFNSHAHVERDMWSIIIGRKNLNFNSHAHVERDEIVTTTDQGIVISTHTLTWSVTKRL